MAFRPLGDRVLVKRVEEEAKTKGGIIIPDTAKEKPQEGEVIAIGDGARDDERQARPHGREGRRQASCSASGRAPKCKIEGEDLIIMKESDILGIVI